jgi:hypothetical protein
VPAPPEEHGRVGLAEHETIGLLAQTIELVTLDGGEEPPAFLSSRSS